MCVMEAWWWWLKEWADSRAGSWQCGEPVAVGSSSRGTGHTGLGAASTRTRFLGFCLLPEPAHKKSMETSLKLFLVEGHGNTN